MTSSTLLYLDGVTVSFDGFRALNELSFLLAPGEMRAVIGPNGAGKTTMMDVITGKTRPDSGRVVFGENTDLTRLDEADTAALGVGRKFQKPTVFEPLSVRDNLLLALAGERTPRFTLFVREIPTERRRIDQILATIRLEAVSDPPAAALSHGQKQWLEIGMLLAQDPLLLLVDEPVAGMTDAETEQTANLLRDINRSHSVVVVEHDMAFIPSLDVMVTVLHEGAVIAEGSIDHVSADPRVVEVYLNHPEAVALITDFVVEGARDGRSVADLMEAGAHVITREQVMEGVADMIHDVQVEATFPDGTKLVTVHVPIR